MFYLLIDVKPLSIPSLMNPTPTPSFENQNEQIIKLADLMVASMESYGNHGMLTTMNAQTKFVLTSIYLFTYSLFNATVGTASPNTDICQANIYILESEISALMIQF